MKPMRRYSFILSAILLTFAELSQGQTTLVTQRAFTASPEELQKAFNGVSAGADAVSVLTENATFDLDAAGRVAFTQRLVFKVWKKDAAESWGMIERAWSPWQDGRPTVRARVISPDGSVHELDPKTIAEAPVRNDDNNLVSDRRTIRAALPAVEPGSVISAGVKIDQ
jgi:hypothetical protein